MCICTFWIKSQGKELFGAKEKPDWTIDHEQRLCTFLDLIHQRGAQFMFSYVLQVEGFYNENVANWAERNNYHVIDIEIPQGRYNNRREVLITNY